MMPSRRVVTYERVSLDIQKDRETILMQSEELVRRLGRDEGVEIVGHYKDEGFSGGLDLHQRPAGAQLLADARRDAFDELWVYKLDRLGRDDIDPLIVRRELAKYNIRLRSLTENLENDLEYGIRVVFAAEERRVIKRRTTDGMNRAARDGRYTGGVCPFGYEIAGEKPNARYVRCDRCILGNWSPAAIVTWMYERVALDKWSCRRVAVELNALGVPTLYTILGRGQRKQKTQGIWRAGRIRNMLVEPFYKGERHFGRRSTTKRDPVIATVPPIVSPELWQAAQDALAANRINPKNTHRTYLSRGVIRCGLCSLTYCGATNNMDSWYRCNGQLIERGPIEGKCPSKAVKTSQIDNVLWDDILRFLEDPGPVLDELRAEYEQEDKGMAEHVDAILLRQRLLELDSEADGWLRLAAKNLATDEKAAAEIAKLNVTRGEVVFRLEAAELAAAEAPPAVPLDLLAELRVRGPQLTIEERQQVVAALVKQVTVFTELDERGKKVARLVFEYRFPAPDSADDCVVPPRTGIREGQNYTTARRVVVLK